jgi:hypothetical protein
VEVGSGKLALALRLLFWRGNGQNRFLYYRRV